MSGCEIARSNSRSRCLRSGMPMKTGKLPVVLIVLIALAVGNGAVISQEGDAQPLQVVVKPLDPFVMGSGDSLNGFSIDLWREIANHLALEYELVEVETVDEQLMAVENGAADVGITGISITSSREERIDFSYPYFSSGLQIMTRVDSQFTVSQIVHNLLSPGILQIVGIFFLVIITGGHLIWLVERRTNPDFAHSYFRGVVEGMWWSSILVVTGNLTDRSPVSALSRLISLIWLVIGVLLIANFTASVTAIATVNQLEQSISTIEDLPGRRIATVQGSTSETHLQQLGIIPLTVSDIHDAYSLLENGTVDAVVYDAPVLRYYESREGSSRVKVVGTIFNPEDYGIALADDSPLRENINRAILALKEDGTYQRLYLYWFGSES